MGRGRTITNPRKPERALARLADSPIRSDRELAGRCRSASLSLVEVERLGARPLDRTTRERVDALRVAAAEGFRAVFTQAEERSARLAKETPRRRERRRRLQDGRRRVAGMTSEARDRHERELRRRMLHGLARRRGATQSEARRFSLGLTPTRHGSAAQIGRERRGACRRRRGSRRCSSGTRAGPDDAGGDDDPGGLATLSRRRRGPHREARS